MSTTKWENYNVEIQNNIQTAGSLEATKTERQRQLLKEKKQCNKELNELLKQINKSDNKYLGSAKQLINNWKENKQEREKIACINTLLDYLNEEQSKLNKNDIVDTAYINRINLSKNQLIRELNNTDL